MSQSSWSGPEVPPPVAAPPPRPQRGLARVVVVVAVAVVLVAGGVVFAFRDKLFGGGSDEPDGFDLVVENPPTLTSTSSFADGLSELWRFSDASIEVVDSSVVIVTPSIEEGVAGHAFTGLDPETGEALWNSGTWARERGRGCDPSLWQGQAVCWTHADPDYHSFLIDPATGQQTQMSWLEGWGPGAYDELFVSEGSLYVVQVLEKDSKRTVLGLTRYDSPGQATWTTSYTFLVGSGPLLASSSRVGDLVAVEGIGSEVQVFDAHVGTLVDGGGWCPSPRVFGGNHVTCEATYGLDRPDEIVPLSNGATVTRTFVRGWPLVFEGPERPSAVVVSDWEGGLTRLDPATGQAMWHNDLDVGSSMDVNVAVAIDQGEPGDEGRIVVVWGAGSRALVDLGTGAVEWQRTGQTELSSFGLPQVIVLGDGLLWVGSGGGWEQRGMVLDLATGDAVVEAEYGLVPGPDGLLVAASHQGDDVVRLAPGGRVVAPPEGLPACPAELSPVAGTRYSDGHVLVCGSAGGDFWVAARHLDEDLDPTKLTFTDGGWTVESDGGTSLAVTLEGGIVDVTGPNPGTYGAAGALLGHPMVDLSDAGEIRSCPEGGRLLSLSTWDDGWLMVCGTAADAPTFAAWGGAQEGETTNVAVESGVYCAHGFGLTACAAADPAVVELTVGASEPVERYVSDNWFDGVGHGGYG